MGINHFWLHYWTHARVHVNNEDYKVNVYKIQSYRVQGDKCGACVLMPSTLR